MGQSTEEDIANLKCRWLITDHLKIDEAKEAAENEANRQIYM